MRVSLDEAAKRLSQGEVVGVPTETVYGLAATLDHPEAIQKIFSLKGRPLNNPLIIHVKAADQVGLFAKQLPPHFFDLASVFWPGPMTLVIPVKEDAVAKEVRANLPTAAFRVPAHPLARQLIELTGPLVMPSANLSGKPSSTSCDHVEEDFGNGFPVLDGGVCSKGLESTILYFTEGKWSIIRQGAISQESFLKVLGYLPEIAFQKKGAAPLCPGQLYRHYAPKAKLKLTGPCPKEGVIVGYSDREYGSFCRLFSLGVSSDADGAAERLYALLRELDEEGVEGAWVDMQVPDDGLWKTLKERLRKAASTID